MACLQVAHMAMAIDLPAVAGLVICSAESAVVLPVVLVAVLWSPLLTPTSAAVLLTATVGVLAAFASAITLVWVELDKNSIVDAIRVPVYGADGRTVAFELPPTPAETWTRLLMSTPIWITVLASWTAYFVAAIVHICLLRKFPRRTLTSLMRMYPWLTRSIAPRYQRHVQGLDKMANPSPLPSLGITPTQETPPGTPRRSSAASDSAADSDSEAERARQRERHTAELARITQRRMVMTSMQEALAKMDMGLMGSTRNAVNVLRNAENVVKGERLRRASVRMKQATKHMDPRLRAKASAEAAKLLAASNSLVGSAVWDTAKRVHRDRLDAEEAARADLDDPRTRGGSELVQRTSMRQLAPVGGSEEEQMTTGPRVMASSQPLSPGMVLAAAFGGEEDEDDDDWDEEAVAELVETGVLPEQVSLGSIQELWHEAEQEGWDDEDEDGWGSGDDAGTSSDESQQLSSQ